MADAPRDWDKELAEIDRLMGTSAGKPSAPVPQKASRPAAAPSRPSASVLPAPPTSRRTVVGAWLRVGLGVALAASVLQWPYAAACGFSLAVYLGVVGMVGVVGTWGAVTTWRRRMGLAHGVALAVIGASLALTAHAILPRIGYARTAATWFCQ